MDTKKEERIFQKEEEIRQMSHLIGAMAHQWKQPLNILGLLIQDIKDAYEYGEVDDAYLSHFVNSGMDNIRTISHSIDDFRNFFTPRFSSENVDIRQMIDEVITMVSHQYQSHKITLELSGNTFFAPAHLNTLRQAIMNIFGTFKDLYDKQDQCEKKIEIALDENKREIRIHESCGILDEGMLGKVFSEEPPSLTELGVYASLWNARFFLADAADATLQTEKEDDTIRFVITFPAV